MNDTNPRLPRLRGLWCATLTPFDAQGGVDLARFTRHAQDLLSRGVDGVAPFGTTGEGPSLTVAERRDALAALLRAGVAPDRIAAGTGAASVVDAVELTRDALAQGVARCLVVPPFFYKNVSDDAVFSFFARLVDTVGDARLRLYLYHIPQFSGVAIRPAVVAHLAAAFPQTIAGVKDSFGDWSNTEALLAAVPQLDIVVGHEPHLPRLMRAGGAGTICGVANVLPGVVRALLQPGVTPEDEARITRFIEILMRHPFLPAFKAMRARQLGDEGWRAVRAPWLELPPDARQALFAELDAADLAA